jgi:hypothetical protein
MQAIIDFPLMRYGGEQSSTIEGASKTVNNVIN